MLEYTKYIKNPNVAPSKLVVMLHGYGSNKNDLINLSPELSKFLPGALFVSPDAPFCFEGMPNGDAKQWFSLLDRSKNALIDEMRIAENYIVDFISAQLNKYNLSEDDLCLLGFSQGTMLSLYLIMQSLITPKLVIGYSGRLFGNNWECGNERKKTKVMLIHGKEDDIVTVEDMLSTTEELKKHGFDTNHFISRHLAHGIDDEGINLGGKFLKDNF
jgi:phospholipase/carboxylesterase